MAYTHRQRAVQSCAGLVFVAAGLGHFLFCHALARLIPTYLSAPAALVLASGVFEIAGGLGLLWGRYRRWASWGLSAMLVSFLPANLFTATHPAEAGFPSIPSAVFGGRIALLPVMIWCLVWCTRATEHAS